MKILKPRLPSAIAIAALCYAASAAADLSLDTTFSGDGIATVSLQPDLDSARDVAVQADGKYVVAGVSRQISGASTFVYAIIGRFNADGTPDTTFGTDGSGTVALLPGGTPNDGGGGDARAIAVQPADQKIVVAGNWNPNDMSGDKIFVARLNTDGSLDTGFGAGGTGQTVIGLAGLVGASTSALALQADGRILVAGGANVFTKQAFIIRLEADASAFDNTFANSGLYTDANPGGTSIPFAFKAVTEIPAGLGGGILAGGGPDDLVLTKLTSSGALDTNFGSGGIATINVATINGSETDDDIKAFALQSDGSILVAGSAEPAPYNGNLNVVLGRVSPGGALDTTYGNNGFVAFNDLSVDELATAVAIRPFGDSVLVGVGFNPTQVSPNGQVTSPLGAFDGGILGSVEPLADGSIVGAGSRQVSGADFEITVVRLNATDRSDLADQTPDAFGFTDQTDVNVLTLVTSDTVTITGIDAPTLISVTGGQYALGCVNPFTSAPGTIQNGQTVCVRHASAALGSTATNTTLTIGGVSDTFTSTTLNADQTPDAFVFTDQTGVSLSTLVTSNAVSIAGIDAPTPISVTGGQYALGCVNPFTSAPGTIQNGQTVCVRHTSAAAGNTATNTTLTIGGVSDTFTSTTVNVDVVPDAFSFTDQTGVDLSITVTSDTVTITGIDAPAPISVTGGEYAIGCVNPFTSASGTIQNNETVCVRHTSAASGNTNVDTTLNIGGVTARFRSTTRTIDQTPDPFVFTDQTGVNLLTLVTSNAVSIAGIDAPTSISVTGGQYALGCVNPFTSAPGTIQNGQTVCVRHTSAAVGSTATNTTLTVGGVSDTFTSTTFNADQTPDAFAFTDQTGVDLLTLVTSNAVSIAGIDAPTPISVTGGEYALGCVNPFTSAPGTIQNGQTVCVRHTSALVGNTATNTTLTIGGVSDTFTSTTLNVDVVPNAFSFTDQTGVNLSALVTSNGVTITGIDAPAPISVTGGSYAIGGCVGGFTTATGRISNGQTVCVQHTSAASGNTNVDTRLNIGSVTARFRSTTRTVDWTPDAFGFAPKANVGRKAFIISETKSITGIDTGIDAPTPISVSRTGNIADGFYSVGCTGALREAPSTITNGQTVCIVVESADADNTPKSATLTVGGVSVVFTVTTGDTVPDPFAFTDQVAVGLSERIYSEPVTISGTNAPSAVTITGGGEYSIDCAGTYTKVAGTVDPPAAGATRTICVRQFASANKTETTSTTLTVGGISDTFTVTTTAAGPLPGASAMDGWSLSILAPLLWLRRRRERLAGSR